MTPTQCTSIGPRTGTSTGSGINSPLEQPQSEITQDLINAFKEQLAEQTKQIQEMITSSAQQSFHQHPPPQQEQEEQNQNHYHHHHQILQRTSHLFQINETDTENSSNTEIIKPIRDNTLE